MAEPSETGPGLDRVSLPQRGSPDTRKLVKTRTDVDKQSHHRRHSLKSILHLGKDHSKDHPERLSAIPTAIPTQDAIQTSYEEKTESRRLNQELNQDNEPSILKKLLHEPVDTTKGLVRGRVAEELSSNLLVAEVPHHHNVELLQSHTAISAAESDSKHQDASDRRDLLLRAQQKELLLWTLNRHLQRVKVVANSPPENQQSKDPDTNTTESPKADYKRSLENAFIRFAYLHGSHYVGYGTYPPPLSQDVLTGIAERLLVVSVPLQYLVVASRRIYRWEDPYETFVYLLIYLLLWSTGTLLSAILFVTVVFVMTRQDRPPSFEDLQRELQRIEDASRRSRSISEFATKQNQSDWLTPLGEALGPAFLVQLGDMASFLEILQNFYEWRVPERTSMSVALLAILAVGAAAVPSWLLIKIATLTCGLIFFFCFPISSHYPDHRLIVSPKTWLFWKIPTHAEWAIAVVQKQAREAREKFVSEDNTIEIARHGCRWEHSRGSIVVTNHDISFVPVLPTGSGWRMRFPSLERMEKVGRHTHARSGKDLHFTLGDGTEYLVKDVQGRDEVFVQILGHSGISWLPEW